MSDQLDLRKTYRAILDAARSGHFISYGDLVKASDADWKKHRYKLNRHLGSLVKIAAERRWPMLTAIVVNQNNIKTGTLDGSSRAGFIGAANEFGFPVSDPAKFVEEQQQAIFAWAQNAPDELGLDEVTQPAKNQAGPRYARFFGPLLDALHKLGGTAKPKQVYDELEKIPLVTKEDLKTSNISGESKFKNEIRWACFYLVKAGLIDNKKRGYWQLTSEGRETHLDHKSAIELYYDIRERYKIANDDEEQSVPPEDDAEVLFDDPNRQFWFVGALWGGNNDQVKRFVSESIWQNGHDDKFSEDVARMKQGDRIAIKASFTKKYGLPFDNQKKRVSCMRIKATGIVTEATKDGKTVKVDWQPLDEPKEWYFYTYFNTISEAETSNKFARRLIQFAFSDHKQDYEFWLREPHWAKLYRAGTTTLADIEDEGEEAIADTEEIEFKAYGIGDILDDGCFLSKEALNSALSRLSAKKNLILQGPPGTGKTWLAKRLGYALIGTKNRTIIRKCMRVIQFHPSLSYEDFVRGWRPDGNGQLSLIDGVFLEAVEAACAERDRLFIVIIEEINRGNPAQIFGEMLTLLEKDKRTEDEAIELSYRRDQTERIYIPENLYVIGTMNIADRSLALVDLALRRRFAFFSLEPAFNDSWQDWCITQAGMDKTILSQIEQRMTELNEEITTDRSLGAQFRIGHSYVTPVPGERIADTWAWFTEIVETEIAPLLEEYWFDNLNKAADSKARLLYDL